MRRAWLALVLLACDDGAPDARVDLGAAEVDARFDPGPADAAPDRVMDAAPDSSPPPSADLGAPDATVDAEPDACVPWDRARRCAEAEADCGVGQLPDGCGGVARSRCGECGRFADCVERRCALVEGRVFNPYYEAAVWKLWSEDPTPVAVDEGVVLAPLPADARLYPLAEPPLPYPDGFLELGPLDEPEVAGFWDDAYATQDDAHTRLPATWSEPDGRRLTVGAQIMRVDEGRIGFEQRLAAGIRFTSESVAERGHQIVDDPLNAEASERLFAFVNTVRGTPAFRSYEETAPDRSVDSYDGLFGHSFQSVGRSGSEVHGLLKMVIVGGFFPRAVKDALTRHGHYALALLGIWRAALPYADAAGAALPFEHELRHRPAYQALGHTRNLEFVPTNAWYHGYDEARHLHAMAERARALAGPPPLTLLKVDFVGLIREGEPVEDPPLLSAAHATHARVWAAPGDDVEARLSLVDSVDLDGRPLTAHAARVYPNQANVEIEAIDARTFRVVARHDPAMPKVRHPVVLWVDNGEAPGNPVYFNVYWPEPGQPPEPPYYHPTLGGRSPDPLHEVHRNLRPELAWPRGDVEVAAAPGSTLDEAVECADPEGFPTHLYRWTGDPGALVDGRLRVDVVDHAVQALHLICSDGTGGYTSARLRVIPTADPLPEPWRHAVSGLPEPAGAARAVEGGFEIAGDGPHDRGRRGARMVLRPAAEHDELAVEVVGLSVEGADRRAGVVVRAGTAAVDPHFFVWRADDDGPRVHADHRARREAGTPSTSAAAPTDRLRLVKRGARIAGFVQGPGDDWVQVHDAELDLRLAPEIGLAVSHGAGAGDPERLARARFELLEVGTAPPFAVLEGALVRLVGPPNATLRYTLDGGVPMIGSDAYVGPFDPRGSIVRAAVFVDGVRGDVLRWTP